MATIALYEGKINNMPSLIKDVNSSVGSLKEDLIVLKNKSLQINKSICNMDDVISSIQASSQMQEQKIASLEMFQHNNEQFIEEIARIDRDVADVINQRKDDFYEEYYYLKPDNEKSWLDNKLDKVSDWCKKHWKDILITVAIVVGAVFAIAIVVFSGGMALAPFIAGVLTTFGIASTTAVTVATVTSLIVAGIAVTSTIAASALNIIDIWGEMGDNKTFQSWKTVMNWASAISNLFYSAGVVYNFFNGITCTQTGQIFNNGIVIGEKMAARVVPYATSNGLGYYNGLWGYSIINNISPKLATFLGTIQNRNFINWSMRYGINIFDIGPSSSQITSVFYQMEQNLLVNYENLFKIILH